MESKCQSYCEVQVKILRAVLKIQESYVPALADSFFRLCVIACKMW